MTTDSMPRLRRAAALGTALALAGALAAGANTIRVPNGGSPEGAVKCATGNPNTARFSQSCGALVTLTSGDTTASFVQDNSPSAESTYHVRFYANLRTLQMLDGTGFDLFAAYDGADPTPPTVAGNAALRVAVQAASGKKQLNVFARLNSGSESTIAAPVTLPDGWRSIEIDWVKATAPGANNGHLNLWIDGKAQTGLSGLNNDTETINYSRWGAVAGLDAGTSGSFRLDDFASQRTAYIGPAFPFADVDSASSFWPFIQGIFAAEVIPDCGVGSFCPNGTITRKEMAKFLLLAKNGASYVPPVCSTPLFSDVPCSNAYAAYINEIAREGITSGCAAGVFCPDGTVTRSQMAVFLMVARGYPAAPCPPSTFLDVATTSPFCGWINQVAAKGITAGCGGGNFCPESLVLRGQMSVFLETTFGIPTHIVGP
ncbi:MAG TPA: S-layer homology domain-containing protein [Thermoanaerobaculia bacterium]